MNILTIATAYKGVSVFDSSDYYWVTGTLYLVIIYVNNYACCKYFIQFLYKMLYVPILTYFHFFFEIWSLLLLKQQTTWLDDWAPYVFTVGIIPHPNCIDTIVITKCTLFANNHQEPFHPCSNLSSIYNTTYWLLIYWKCNLFSIIVTASKDLTYSSEICI